MFRNRKDKQSFSFSKKTSLLSPASKKTLLRRRPSHHSKCRLIFNTCRVRTPDISPPGRGGAAHSEAAGRYEARQDGTPGRFAQETTAPRAPQGIEDNWLNVFSEARTNEILCKPMEEHDNRLTQGLYAVDNRFIREATAALCSKLLTRVPTPICLCKPFSGKACSGKLFGVEH